MSYRSESWTTAEPRTVGSPDEETADVERTDRLFEVLTHEHRRIAVSHLAEQDEAVTLDELVAVVVEASAWPGGSDRGERESMVATGFHHAHLGKLVDSGVIHYDPEKRTIEPTDTAVLGAYLLGGI